MPLEMYPSFPQSCSGAGGTRARDPALGPVEPHGIVPSPVTWVLPGMGDCEATPASPTAAPAQPVLSPAPGGGGWGRFPVPCCRRWALPAGTMTAGNPAARGRGGGASPPSDRRLRQWRGRAGLSSGRGRGGGRDQGLATPPSPARRRERSKGGPRVAARGRAALAPPGGCRALPPAPVGGNGACARGSRLPSRPAARVGRGGEGFMVPSRRGKISAGKPGGGARGGHGLAPPTRCLRGPPRVPRGGCAAGARWGPRTPPPPSPGGVRVSLRN